MIKEGHEDSPGDWRKDVSIDDCIDAALDALRRDAGATVIWYQNHAYVIPSGANDNTTALNISRNLTIAGVVFPVKLPFPDFTSGELNDLVSSGQATDITNLVKRYL